MKRLRSLTMTVLVAGLVASCSDPSPTRPGTHSLSGRLDLRGYFVDADGNFVGTRVLGDADGLPVELLYGDQVVSRTTTVRGRYRFDGLKPGGYFARSRVLPGIEDMTRRLVIADRDVEARDTLKLASIGDLYPFPNPFADSFRVVFEIARRTQARLTLRDATGRAIRTLFNLELLPAQHTVYVRVTEPPPAGTSSVIHWITLEAGTETRAQLLVRKPAAP